jgi:hypothetical protein
LGLELLAFGIHWNDFVMFPIFSLDKFMTDLNLYVIWISSNPDDKEILASYWYSKEWDKNITNPNTQVLLCLEAYINKTGKSAGLTSYCGEPFLLSSLHLKKSVQEQSGAWLVQAYLPNLEPGFSAKKYSHSHKTHGRTNCNYHKVMKAVLQGVPAYVQMDDIVHRLMVIPVIAFIKGDAKSSNTLVSRFRGKNCTLRVPRLCFTSLKHLADPMHKCCWVQMVDWKALNDKVTDLLVSPPNEANKNRTLHLKERKEYLAALDNPLNISLDSKI